MERDFERTYIKKGPWSSEEDEVLLNHVSKYGPRDWSSIRSKGLLPRTGKSCRLRWVNKLRPNLKTGCKFTAEEERVVIELQAQFGNKWAKIASYLQGRTDNDVKNFWSSRRKRLERMLKRPSPSKPHKNKGKSPLNQVQVEEEQEEGPICISTKAEEIPCCNYRSYPPSSFMGNTTEDFKMVNLPDLTKPNNYQDLQCDEANNNNPFHMVPSFGSSTEYNTSSFPHEPQMMDFPLFPEAHDLLPEPIDPNFIDVFDDQKKCGTTLGLEGNTRQSKCPNGFFEDFPIEIFEYFDHNIPTSSE